MTLVSHKLKKSNRGLEAKKKKVGSVRKRERKRQTQLRRERNKENAILK